MLQFGAAPTLHVHRAYLLPIPQYVQRIIVRIRSSSMMVIESKYTSCLEFEFPYDFFSNIK